MTPGRGLAMVALGGASPGASTTTAVGAGRQLIMPAAGHQQHLSGVKPSPGRASVARPCLAPTASPRASEGTCCSAANPGVVSCAPLPPGPLLQLQTVRVQAADRSWALPCSGRANAEVCPLTACMQCVPSACACKRMSPSRYVILEKRDRDRQTCLVAFGFGVSLSVAVTSYYFQNCPAAPSYGHWLSLPLAPPPNTHIPPYIPTPPHSHNCHRRHHHPPPLFTTTEITNLNPSPFPDKKNKSAIW